MTGPIESVRSVDAERRQVTTVLRNVAASTKSDFNFLLKVAERESSLRADARASTSSASGLFQFIEQTWLEAVKKHGGAVGLGAEAAAISKSGDGYAVASPERREEILNKRFDPEAAAKIAVKTFRETAAILSSALGRKPDGGELYLAHFLGPTGAARMIKADGAATAAEIAPAAARANASLFYKDGAPVSVDAFRKSVFAAFSEPPAKPAASGAPVGPVPTGRAAPIRIDDYAPPMASAGSALYQGNILPMSVFREMLALDAVRTFAGEEAGARDNTGAARDEDAS